MYRGAEFKLDIRFNKLDWQAGLICTLVGSNTTDAENTTSRVDMIKELAAKLAPKSAYALAA